MSTRTEYRDRLIEALRQRDEAVALLRWAMAAGRISYSQRTSSNVDYCDSVDKARAFLASLDGGKR